MRLSPPTLGLFGILGVLALLQLHLKFDIGGMHIEARLNRGIFCYTSFNVVHQIVQDKKKRPIFSRQVDMRKARVRV